MKLVSFIAGLICMLIPASSSGNFFKDYFKDGYPIQIVEKMPVGIGSQLLMISTRHFRNGDEFSIRRGLDPRLNLSLFIAGLRNDTAFLIPLDDFNEVVHFLPDGKDFLILVDGHGKTFSQSMERGFELGQRFNINLVVFDWPTDNLALRKTIYNASEVTVGFVRAMRKLDTILKDKYINSSVSVIFHSMGNRIIADISSTNLLKKMPDKLFSNIIINAAAVKQHNHAKWVEKLSIQKRIYITMNHRDFNLRGAAMIRLAEQLGLSNRNKTARNAFYVNFSELSTFEHNLFLGRSQLEKTNPEVFVFYDLAFHGKEVNLGEHIGFQILSPSDKSFLFSEK